MQSAPQPQPYAMRGVDASAIETLNRLLAREIAATETYTYAMSKIDSGSRALLQDNLDSHHRRVQALRERIVASGGVPVDGSGMWGAFSRLMERGAALLGRDAAIAALEEGEDLGLRDYREAVTQLTSTMRTWVAEELLPLQVRSHAVLSDARNSGKGPGPGAGGMMPTMLMAMAISLAALVGSGCHDERKVSLNDVTPEARSTITRLTGPGEVTAIDEITSTGKDVAYDVTIVRDGKRQHYRIDGYGQIKD